MNRVCCIIDLEGFQISGRFLVRELGWIRIQDGNFGNFHFDLSRFTSNLSRQDIETISYVTSNVSGLTFAPMPGENAISLHLLDSKIREIYNICKSPGKDLMAYKGGVVEKEILQRLGIPCLDLENYGCPKYNEIHIYGRASSCGLHSKNLHCPTSEVQAFRSWMLRRL